MLAENGQIKMFGANLYLIIGALIFLSVVLILIFVAWTAAKAGLWQFRRRRFAQNENRRKIGPDGRPYPPVGRGVCQVCNRAHEEVYYLPSGERRCPACYEELLTDTWKK
jgi:hypothetical protein